MKIYTDFIDEYGVHITICVDNEQVINNDVKKQIGEIASLVHILLVVGVEYNPKVIKLLLDTLVGLGLTITDGEGLAENLAKEICKKHETYN